MITSKDENPWTVQSIYDLQYFGCPACLFKDNSKQNFVNHAYEIHPESIGVLRNINDGSLSDVDCPWDISEIKIEEQLPVKCEIKEEIEESDSKINIPTFVDEEVDWDNDEKTNQEHVHCKICHKVFTCKYYLKKHIKVVHEGQRNYHCDREKCGKRFGCQQSLKKHIKMVHETNAEFKVNTDEVYLIPILVSCKITKEQRNKNHLVTNNNLACSLTISSFNKSTIMVFLESRLTYLI